MKALIDSGHSAGEAAALAVDTAIVPAPAAAEGGETQARLRAALERFDDAAANDVLDEALSSLSAGAVVDRVVLPCMREIGERWERGEVSVAQEHFASNLVRGRLLAIARKWGAGGGPVALLACPPGELHDLGLVSFGVALREGGWRIVLLGADTPIETVADAAVAARPAAVVIAALDPARFEESADGLARLAAERRVLIAGAGATPELAERVGAEALGPDPVRAALNLAVAPAGAQRRQP
jgi:methanogenic corrinoid protein MtbC1